MIVPGVYFGGGIWLVFARCVRQARRPVLVAVIVGVVAFKRKRGANMGGKVECQRGCVERRKWGLVQQSPGGGEPE